LKFALVTIETERSRRNILEDRAKHRKSIEAWMAEQARAGKLVGGEAFETEKMGPVTVRHDDSGAVTVAEEPFAGESETLGGFLLVDVADREEAVELAKSWPSGETIEVRPVWTAS
jgi:hypothetical protein